MNMRHTFKYICLSLSCLLLLTALVGCSDQILLENGEIVTKGQSLSTSAPAGDTTPATPEDVTIPSLSIGTQAATMPSISIGGDPEDIFKDSENLMRVDFLDTGESDCIIIRVGGKVILVDTADIDDSQKIKNKLTEFGVTAIDCLILTHYDNDHIGSVSAVLADFAVGEVYMPDYVRDSGLYRSMTSALESVEPARVHRIWGETVSFELGGATFSLNATALYERGVEVAGDNTTSGIVENNFSIITSVTLGEVSLLLTGDAEADRMKEFDSQFAEGAYPKYALIKTPHHGDYFKELKTSLGGARPRYCVVCTDMKDKVEASLVTEMLSSGAFAYYTFNGDVSYVTDGSVSRYLMTQK